MEMIAFAFQSTIRYDVMGSDAMGRELKLQFLSLFPVLVLGDGDGDGMGWYRLDPMD